MKKFLISLFLIFSVSSAVGITANIDTVDTNLNNDPPTIELNSTNNYEVDRYFNGSQSSGNISSYSWVLKSTEEDQSGQNSLYTFDRDSGLSDNNDVELTVSDSDGNKDVSIVTQEVKDVPNASISSVGSTSIDTGESVKFTSSVTNAFDNSISYTWNGDVSGSGENFTKTFDSSGSYNVKLTVEDGANLSSTTSGITVDVSSPSNNDDPDDSNDDSPSNPSEPVAPTNPSDNETDNETEDDAESDQVSDEKSNNVNKSSMSVVAEPENGVAKVNVEKEEGVNEISVSVDYSGSDSAPVKNIRIESSESGQVSVSVRDAGRDKPSKISEPASEQEENVYNYQEINTSINDSEVDVAEVDFSVNKSWVEERNRTKEEVVMKRLNDDSWEKLETNYLNETDEEYNFEASSSGFSYYAVALEDSSNDTVEDPKTDSGSEESQGRNPLIYLAVLLGLAALAAALYLRSKGYELGY